MAVFFREKDKKHPVQKPQFVSKERSCQRLEALRFQSNDAPLPNAEHQITGVARLIADLPEGPSRANQGDGQNSAFNG